MTAEEQKLFMQQAETIKTLTEQVRVLTAQLVWFQRQMFGRKSEKMPLIDPNQLSLFDEQIPQVVVEAQAEATQQIEKETPADKKQERQNRKMMVNLKVIERIVLRPEGIDDTYHKIGEEITRVVKYIPAQLGILEYVREKYAKDNADKTTTDIRIAPLPLLPINKCIADASLLAETLLNKYEYHLPLYRQVQQYKHLGFEVKESTIDGWIKPTAELLRPLYDTLVTEIFKSSYIQCDETTTPVVDKETHKANKEYLWMARAVKERLRCFHYNEGSRSGEVIKKLAEDNHFRGYLQCDGYTGYESVFKDSKDVQLVNCMAHIRRHFEAALEENKQMAEFAIGEIQKLYQIERNCNEQNLSAEERKQKREQLARPIMEHLKLWMETEGIKYSERSLSGKAVTYAYTRWSNMMRYLEDGSIQIDNNLAENAIRPITLGRKNYLFCGNHEAAGWMSIICSLIGTCKEHHVNPRLYLNDVIAQMPYVVQPLKAPSQDQLLQLLPHNWAQQHPEAVLATE